MYKGRRLEKSMWENIVHVTIGTNKYVKRMKCGHRQANNAVRMQVHYTIVRNSLPQILNQLCYPEINTRSKSHSRSTLSKYSSI